MKGLVFSALIVAMVAGFLVLGTAQAFSPFAFVYPTIHLSDFIWINGQPYSGRLTPYGTFTIVTEVHANGLGWCGESFSLLVPNETLPLNCLLLGGYGCPYIVQQPLNYVMIPTSSPRNLWMYSLTPTNYTYFTMPLSSQVYWTETAKEPLPPNAQLPIGGSNTEPLKTQ